MKTVRSIFLCLSFMFGLSVFASLNEEAIREYEEQAFEPILMRLVRIKPNVLEGEEIRPIVVPVSAFDEESLKIFEEQLKENYELENEEYALKLQVTEIIPLVTVDDVGNCLKPQVITGDDEENCLKPQVIIPN